MPMWIVFGVQSSAMLTGVLPELVCCDEPQPVVMATAIAAAIKVIIETLFSCFTFRPICSLTDDSRC